jgi:hypothetical protein
MLRATFIAKATRVALVDLVAAGMAESVVLAARAAP